MAKGTTILAFLISCFLSVFSTLYFPEYRIVAFAPFLASRINRFYYLPLIWLCILSGFVADATSVQYRFGLSSLYYAISLSMLFPFRRQFLEEKPLPFWLLTFIISAIVTFLFSLVSLFKNTIQFANLFIFIKEIFISSLFDVVVGFIFIFIPIKIYGGIKEKGIKRLLTRREEI